MSFAMGKNFLDRPSIMNIELTTRCPLRCPQCYCDLTKGKDIDRDTAVRRLRDAAASGVRRIALSGGETLCYPALDDLIRECTRLGLESNIALSGALVTKERLLELAECGVTGIYVSLNGSTEKINALSRDGFQSAIRALELLAEIGFERRFINWVMHSFNADDFENVVRTGERFGVKAIAVLMFKPDSARRMKSIPTQTQMERTAAFIRSYRGPVRLIPESCFSQMRAMTGVSFIGNSNTGVSRGCGAGRDGISVNVDGKLTPCRHIDIAEDFDSVTDYWNGSKILRALRDADDAMEEPCGSCRLNRNCVPCMAVNENMKGRIFFGCESCPVQEKYHIPAAGQS